MLLKSGFEVDSNIFTVSHSARRLAAAARRPNNQPAKAAIGRARAAGGIQEPR